VCSHVRHCCSTLFPQTVSQNHSILQNFPLARLHLSRLLSNRFIDYLALTNFNYRSHPKHNDLQNDGRKHSHLYNHHSPVLQIHSIRQLSLNKRLHATTLLRFTLNEVKFAFNSNAKCNTHKWINELFSARALQVSRLTACPAATRATGYTAILYRAVHTLNLHHRGWMYTYTCTTVVLPPREWR